MKLHSLIRKLGTGALLGGDKRLTQAPPTLTEPLRYPYGPFRFRTKLPKGTAYTILTSTDLKTWAGAAQLTAAEETVEYVDSETFKHSYRFYRLKAGEVFSTNVVGYAAVSLPPGFSIIANPFEGSETVEDTFKNWPNATTLSKFDTLLFRLSENEVKGGKWTNPTEKLSPGEGAIFFNPTQDYKSATFVGEVLEGSTSVPIPAGFSIRSALRPQPGSLDEDLKFPIGNGDVIHLFDREQQKYVLHPYEAGKWTAGAPILSVGEAFWVAKKDPGNWNYDFVVS